MAANGRAFVGRRWLPATNPAAFDAPQRMVIGAPIAFADFAW
jgi:hypothetical protein